MRGPRHATAADRSLWLESLVLLAAAPFLLFPDIFPVLTLLGLLALSTGLLQASPDVQSWTTRGGAKGMYVHAPDLPMVDLRVVFDAGSARDGKLPGLAVLTNGVLTDGGVVFDNQGIETKKFHIRDGLGISNAEVLRLQQELLEP